MSYSTQYVKNRTLEIYRSLPQEKSLRINCIAERDEIIDLNYKFFGYVASHTFINNPSISYEDKFQSALLHFLESWWWYLWKGDDTHKGYRQDVSFAVFYKPRISEMIERELNQVKYSLRRTLCMEVGEQIGKHWAQVRYEDLSDPRVKLSSNKMNSLKAIFGSLYIADLSDHELYVPASNYSDSILDTFTEKYDSVEELLIYEMISSESKISDKELLKMSDMYQIDINILFEKRSVAEQLLYDRIISRMDISQEF